MTDLTEQMHKGKLPEGWYYVIKTGDVEMLEYSCNCFLAGDVPLVDNEVTEVLAPVPSYEEYEQLENWNRFTADYHALREAKEIAEYEKVELLEKVKQLKESLKECELWFTGTVGNMNDKNFGEHNRNLPIGNFEHIFKVFSQKINEVLDAK